MLQLIARPWLSADALSVVGGGKAACRIGVRTFRNDHGGAVRVFYPGCTGVEQTATKKARIFRSSFGDVVGGFMHVFAGSFFGKKMRHGSLLFTLASFFLRIFTFLHPLSRAHVPYCTEELPTRKDKGKAPLLMWSHGLTGTADEHALMAASLAADGNVVALVHHCDGSSSRSDLSLHGDEASVTYKYYMHPPPPKEYDPTMRPGQINKRADELEDSRRLLLDGRCGTDIAGLIDVDRCAVGGFSFGAATAAHLAATTPKGRYKCCIMWDGWFHVEIGGHRVDMPEAAFARGLSMPCLFVGSQQFAGYANLNDATQRLIAKSPLAEAHVCKDTLHQNFADVVWWVSRASLARLGVIGAANPVTAYASIVGWTKDFMARKCENENAVRTEGAPFGIHA